MVLLVWNTNTNLQEISLALRTLVFTVTNTIAPVSCRVVLQSLKLFVYFGLLGHKLRKGHSDEKINGNSEKINGHADMDGHAVGKMNGHGGAKVNGHGGDKIQINGHGGDKINDHGGDKLNAQIDKIDICASKMNGLTNGHAKMNGVMNGGTHEINNLKSGHRMDLGTPKIQKVAVKT